LLPEGRLLLPRRFPELALRWPRLLPKGRQVRLLQGWRG
jgi:hypothetical protein